MDEYELFADEFTPPRGDCPRFLVCLFEIGITNYELGIGPESWKTTVKDSLRTLQCAIPKDSRRGDL